MEWNGTDENKITNSSTEAIKERKHLRVTVTTLEVTGKKIQTQTCTLTHTAMVLVAVLDITPILVSRSMFN